MATLRVETRDFPRVIGFIEGIRRRVVQTPSRWQLRASGLAAIHQAGGRQTVKASVQRAIAAKTGATPPRAGTVMIHPRRPIRVTRDMAKKASRGLAKSWLGRGKHGIEAAMRGGALIQMDQGGDPPWVASRDWGNFRARRPTLGGRGSRVGSEWARARFVEIP